MRLGPTLAQRLNDALFQDPALRRWPDGQMVLGLAALFAGYCKAAEMDHDTYTRLSEAAYKVVEGTRKKKGGENGPASDDQNPSDPERG